MTQLQLNFNPEPILAQTPCKPLLKWTGGKYREYSQFSHLIPAEFNRYVEPFAGGAGVFFAHQPERAYLNDLCTDLIEFYDAVKAQKHVQDFKELGMLWADLAYYSEVICEQLSENNWESPAGVPQFYDWEPAINSFVLHSVKDKLKRIKVIAEKANITWNDKQRLDHVETAVKAGIYTYLRAITNNEVLSKIPKTVAWFFVREFCYSSMFRFSKGKMNVPYGGISYNSKDIMTKIAQLNSAQVNEQFKNTTFSNKDFGAFIDDMNLTEEDFIFLDPPYDSPFSKYDDNAFGKKEHIRLRETLAKTRAKWMLVISVTDFIADLYQGENAQYFDKTYAVNVNKSNDKRKATHVIFTNY